MEIETSEAAALYRKTERRIEFLTLALGAAVAVVVAIVRSRLEATGILIGAGLAWVNFRWLRLALDALTKAQTVPTGGPKGHIPLSSYARMAGRYGLIGLVLYVMFSRFGVPILSMLVGLCSLGVATTVMSLYEAITHPGIEDGTSR